MKAMRIATAVVVILVAGACAPPGGAQVDPTCPTTDRWAVGDSFTDGYGGVAGWPDQSPPIAAGSYANKGVAGKTIAWLRIQTQLDLAACEDHDLALPERIVFQAGANDLANYRLTVAEMQEQVQALVGVLEAADVDVRLVSIAPIPIDADWSIANSSRLAFNGWLAATYPTKYVDCDDDLRAGTWLAPAYSFGDRAGAVALARCVQDES
jgi:hypothetical protein